MIAIINPPNPPNAVSNKDTMGGFGQLYPFGAKNSFPPIDIPYTAAVLKNKGIPLQIIECLGLHWEISELILRLQEQKPTLAAIRTSVPTFEWDMRIARIIKMVTGSKIVVFGPCVALYAKETLDLPFVDAIILGEPEMVILDICERGGFRECKGVWHKENGNILKNLTRKPIDDLDQLPYPAWDLVPYRSYSGMELMRNLKPFVTALTSRGCPHGCAYCAYPVAQGRKLRTRTPKNVVNELEWLRNTLDVRAVLFRDPEFAFYRDRVVGICERIIKRGLQLAWRCETRIENLDTELISLMAKAGCIGINMGVESADETVLRNLKRKPIPLGQAIKVVKACKKNGIDAFCFFILGLPGETKRSALRTIDYALKINPNFVQFTVATPYPGTGLRVWAEEKKYIENDSMTAITGYEIAMRNEHMTYDEIRWLQRFALEAIEMQWQKIAIRFLRNAFQLGSEIKRWVRFQRARIMCRL